MQKHYTLTVIEKVVETNDAVTIKFKQPALKQVRYEAGQYITLIVKLNGRVYRRPYSVASVFGIDRTLNITIKAIEKGVVSNYIVNNAKVGDIFEIMEPVGKFVLPEKFSDGLIFFWCAGSGITPCFSILRKCLYDFPDSKIVLIYCNRDYQSIIFKQQLLELENLFLGRLKVFHVLSRPLQTVEKEYFEGRITTEIIHQILKSNLVSKDSHHYLCGPGDFIKMITDVIDVYDINNENVHHESFHKVVTENQLVGVLDSRVQLKMGENTYSFDVPFGKSILDACLDNAIEFPYSCQTGSCCFCKATLVRGALKILSESEPEKELSSNEFLLCCAYPLEKEIYLIS